MYCLTSPFAFSIALFCHEEYGSAKYTGTPRDLLIISCAANFSISHPYTFAGDPNWGICYYLRHVLIHFFIPRLLANSSNGIPKAFGSIPDVIVSTLSEYFSNILLMSLFKEV